MWKGVSISPCPGYRREYSEGNGEELWGERLSPEQTDGDRLQCPQCVSNSERGYHVFSDVGTKLEFVGFNEAVHVRVATDIFSRIGLTRCLSDPYIPSAGCGDLIS